MDNVVKFEYPDFSRTEPGYERPAPLICDTLTKAIEALDELGLCMNQAVVTAARSNLNILWYQGWTYESTPERFVLLPFETRGQEFSQEFEDLLRRIFKPFVTDGSMVRSLFRVALNPGEGLAGNRCFTVDLVLVFGSGVYRQICDALASVADSDDPGQAHYFCLD